MQGMMFSRLEDVNVLQKGNYRSVFLSGAMFPFVKFIGIRRKQGE